MPKLTFFTASVFPNMPRSKGKKCLFYFQKYLSMRHVTSGSLKNVLVLCILILIKVNLEGNRKEF